MRGRRGTETETGKTWRACGSKGRFKINCFEMPGNYLSGACASSPLLPFGKSSFRTYPTESLFDKFGDPTID